MTRVEQYLTVRPQNFPVVHSLCISQREPDDSPPVLDLVLDLSRRDNLRQRLRVTFSHVRALVLKQPNLSLFQIGFLEIVDIVDRQLEGIKFRVRDTEDDSISLLCADFSFVVTDEAIHSD